MAAPFSQIHIHLVFSTKDRRNPIPKEWQPRQDKRVAGHARQIVNEIQKPHPCKDRKGRVP
jgi:hypothetical protein